MLSLLSSAHIINVGRWNLSSSFTVWRRVQTDDAGRNYRKLSTCSCIKRIHRSCIEDPRQNVSPPFPHTRPPVFWINPWYARCSLNTNSFIMVCYVLRTQNNNAPTEINIVGNEDDKLCIPRKGNTAPLNSDDHCCYWQTAASGHMTLRH